MEAAWRGSRSKKIHISWILVGGVMGLLTSLPFILGGIFFAPMMLGWLAYIINMSNAVDGENRKWQSYKDHGGVIDVSHKMTLGDALRTRKYPIANWWIAFFAVKIYLHFYPFAIFGGFGPIQWQH